MFNTANHVHTNMGHIYNSVLTWYVLLLPGAGYQSTLDMGSLCASSPLPELAISISVSLLRSHTITSPRQNREYPRFDKHMLY